MGDMVPVFQSVWSLIGKPLKEFITNVWRGLQSVWKNIAPEVAKFADEFDDLIPALRGLKNVVKLVVGYLFLRFSLLASILLNIAANVIKPMITTIGNVMENLIQIIRGAFQIVVGILMLFTSDWREGLKKIVAGVWNILSGLGGIIGNILKGAFEIAIGLVVGVVKGIWRWFVWLWDVLVGHSVIPDMIDGIIHYFEMLMILPKWLWNHVIKPVYNFFKAMWTDYVGPFLRSIWGKVKLSLAGWKMMGRWVWDNVLRPAWNKVQDLWGKVGPELRKWWERIKVAWALLKLMASWVWNNVLKPAWNKIKDLWSLYVKPELGKWWERIKLVWNSLTNLGKWIKNNVMDPVLNAFKNGWGAVKDWMNNNKGILTNPVKAIVNVVISAVNAMIRGLNKIA
ncbi:MAG TPA: hypothetical protein VJQ25_14205, partial [Nitrospira sp.]|nr:hypothetical protein [Nitrospira sp.]